MSKFVDQIIRKLREDHHSWEPFDEQTNRVGGHNLRSGNIKLCQIGNSRFYSVIRVLVDDREVPMFGWWDQWRLEGACMQWYRRAELAELGAMAPA